MLTRSIKVYAATALCMLLLDALWLGLIAAPWYSQGIGHLMAGQPRWSAAALFYVLYPAGLVWWAVLPQASTAGLRSAALQGGLLGLFAYGTYDLSNLATLRDWPLSVAVVDMAWGALASAVSAAAGKAALGRQPRG